MAIAGHLTGTSTSQIRSLRSSDVTWNDFKKALCGEVLYPYTGLGKRQVKLRKSLLM
jgi:hypothetical protein